MRRSWRRSRKKMARQSQTMCQQGVPFENRFRGRGDLTRGAHAVHPTARESHDMHGIATVLRPAPAPARHRRRGFDRASARAKATAPGGPLDGENISEFKTPFFNDRGPSTPMPTSDPVRLFCLDRDGVINKDVGVPGVVDVDDFELLPEAARAIRSLNDAGVSVCVVTNQTAVGKGLLPESTLNEVIHPAMRRMLYDEAGASIGSILYAIKPRDVPCDRRKPAPGMLLEAMNEHGCMDVYYGCIMVGDTVTDMQAAARAGARRALVCTGHGEAMGAALAERNVELPCRISMRCDDPTMSFPDECFPMDVYASLGHCVDCVLAESSYQWSARAVYDSMTQ